MSSSSCNSSNSSISSSCSSISMSGSSMRSSSVSGSSMSSSSRSRDKSRSKGSISRSRSSFLKLCCRPPSVMYPAQMREVSEVEVVDLYLVDVASNEGWFKVTLTDPHN